MEDIKDYILWLIGGLTAIVGWVMRLIFGRLDKLEKDHERLEKDIDKRLDCIDKELALNTQADQMQYEKIMEALARIEEKIKQYDKNSANFYAINPDLKRPEE